MSLRTIQLTDELNQYLLDHSLRDTDVRKELREVTSEHPMARMQISPEQGQFMFVLAKMLRATKAIDVGVFTGYSSLLVAEALPADGMLVACDINAEITNIGKLYWEKAGVAEKIDLRIAPALDTLNTLLEEGHEASFDMAFLDADKREYPAYYEACLKLLRVGGAILVDNVLWGGNVINEDDQSEDTVAIRKFNKELLTDERVDLSMVPIGDGLTLAIKR